MTASESRLALPLVALFVAFFVAPLLVLLALSLHTDVAMKTWTVSNYVKFFTDPFNYSILIDTLLLGLKATIVCLIFGFLGYRATRAGQMTTQYSWINTRAGFLRWKREEKRSGAPIAGTGSDSG